MAGLFPYQLEHAAFMERAVDRHPVVINPSDTGTGKTYTTADLCRRKHRRAFVVCPKPVIESWYKVLSDFGVEVLGVVNYEAIKHGKYYADVGMFRADKRVPCPYINVIENRDETEFIWELPPDAFLIFDEAHKGKNHITINSKLITSSRACTRVGVKIIILSATITDKVENLRVAAYMLGLAQFQKHAYRAWLRSLGIDGNANGMHTLERIHRAIYPEYGHRMRITDIKESDHQPTREMFKENDVLAETYPMSPEVQEGIEEAHAQIRAALDALRNKEMMDGDHPLTVLLRARQRLETLKIPTLVELAMEYLTAGKSVVIFVNFNESITQLVGHLNEFVIEMESEITFIHGEQSNEERERQKRLFQADQSRLMIANIAAGGVAISLHDLNGRHQRVSLISPTWSAIALKQCLGRIYRAGALTDAIQRIVYCRGKTKPGAKGNDGTCDGEDGLGRIGVEEYIAHNVNKKLRTIEWINNGDEEDLELI